MNVITIANTSVNVIEYQGQRVVTLGMIDQVHQRPDGTAKRNFHENRDKFVNGEDFIELTASEIRTESLTDVFPPRTPKGIVFFESGYLMLVKSLQDDLAWKVQRELVKGYFRAKADDGFRLDPVTDQPKVRRANATDPLILQYKQADAVLSSTMKAAKMLGTDKAMARVLAVDAARQKTGIDFGNLLAGNSVEEKPVTPTVLGKDHGWTGKQTNINLETAGYQAKDEDGQWLPTEMGKPFCTVNPYKSPNSAHTGYRVLWCRRVLDAMDQTMTDRQPVTGNVIPMRGATI